MVKTVNQRHTKHIILALVTLLTAWAMLVISFSLPVGAQAPASTTCTDEQLKNPDPSKPCLPGDTIKPTPDPAAANGCKQGESCDASRILGGSSIIEMYINPLIRTLTAIIAVVIAIALVVSGIQYSSSRGDPSKVAAAKERIMKVIIALLAYLFAAGFINWILPGGLLGAQ